MAITHLDQDVNQSPSGTSADLDKDTMVAYHFDPGAMLMLGAIVAKHNPRKITADVNSIFAKGVTVVQPDGTSDRYTYTIFDGKPALCVYRDCYGGPGRTRQEICSINMTDIFTELVANLSQVLDLKLT